MCSVNAVSYLPTLFTHFNKLYSVAPMFDGQLTTVHHGHKASLSQVFPSHEAQVHDHGSHGHHAPPVHMNDASSHVDPGPAPVHEGHDSMANHDHGEKDHGGGGHMMSMAFHTGDTETILFNFWRTESALALSLSCILIFFVAVFYEGLKFYRAWLFENKRRRLQGGRDQYGSPRRYREQNQNYNQPTYPYRQPPPYPQTQGQTQVYAYRPTPPPMPPIQTGEAPAPPSPQTSQMMPGQPPHGAGHHHHIQEPSPEAEEKVPWRRRLCSGMHLYQTFLHVLQVFISFLLMLVFMTFNVWLCVAVLLGAGVGYFIFCAFSSRINEHCN